MLDAIVYDAGIKLKFMMSHVLLDSARDAYFAWNIRYRKLNFDIEN